MHALLIATLLPICSHSITAVVDTPPPMWKLERTPMAPTYTAYTVKPELLNRPEVARALVRAYPHAARMQHRGANVLLWVLVDEKGNVLDPRVKESAGREFDRAALAVARVMRFSPARLREAPVPVWIQLPIVFKPR